MQKIGIITQTGNPPFDPQKLITPNTTTNRQNSLETGKHLTLKMFQQVKQISSTVVTPKNLKCKTGAKKHI